MGAEVYDASIRPKLLDSSSSVHGGLQCETLLAVYQSRLLRTPNPNPDGGANRGLDIFVGFGETDRVR